MEKEIKKTQNYYNSIAKGYKQLYHKEQIKKINLVKKYLPSESESVLDLGCADGVLNQLISKKIKLISADLSYELLKLNSNKNRICLNAQNLSFKKNSFDMVLTFTILQDTPKPNLIIKQIKNILKPNRILILSFIKISKKKELIEKEIQNNFKLIEKIEEEKDFIYILENTKKKKKFFLTSSRHFKM